jgi:hypothetical protein
VNGLTGLTDAWRWQVNAGSTATAKALAARNPALRFVVQMREDVSHVTSKPKPGDSASACPARQGQGSMSAPNNNNNKLVVQRRAPGTPQHETSAAVYLLHIPDPFFCASSGAHAAVCTAELRAHLELLRANSCSTPNGTGTGTTLILIADVLPEASAPNAPNAPVEAVARFQDVLLLQMGHEEAFDMTRLMGLLESVGEDTDRLTVVNQLSSPDHPIRAFELRARPPSNGQAGGTSGQ